MAKNLVGHPPFERLTVERRSEKKSSRGILWLCRCSCGGTKEVETSRLLSGAVRSCGCLATELLKKRHREGRMPYKGRPTHGGRRLPEYQVWVGMIRRCEDDSRKEYERYGGVGVTVCRRWRESFAAFLEDMGPRPTSAHTLERKSTKKGYTPSNCEWATRKEQTKNRKNTIFVKHRGESLSLAEWSDRTGLSLSCLQQRYYAGKRGPALLDAPNQRSKT